MAERTTIYLDDAINLLEELETKRLQGDVGLLYAPMLKGLKALPPAQSEIIQCENCKHWRRMTTSAGTSSIYGFCESDAMWMSLSGETTEVSHIDTYNDFHCGYAERRTDEQAD